MRSSICASGILPKRSACRLLRGHSALLRVVRPQSLQLRREKNSIKGTRDTALKFRNEAQSAAAASSRRPRRSRGPSRFFPPPSRHVDTGHFDVTCQAHKRVALMMVNKVMTMAFSAILACSNLQRGYDSRDRSSASEWPTTRSHCALRGTIFQPQGPRFGAQRSHPHAPDVVYGEARGLRGQLSMHPARITTAIWQR